MTLTIKPIDNGYEVRLGDKFVGCVFEHAGMRGVVSYFEREFLPSDRWYQKSKWFSNFEDWLTEVLKSCGVENCRLAHEAWLKGEVDASFVWPVEDDGVAA